MDLILKNSVILPCLRLLAAGSGTSPGGQGGQHVGSGRRPESVGCDVGGISSRDDVDKGEQGSVMSLLLEPKSPQWTATPLKQVKKRKRKNYGDGRYDVYR